MVKFKQNILCIIGQLGSGGTEKQLYLFLKYLNREYYHSTVFVAGDETGIWEKKIKEELNIEIVSTGNISQFKKILLYRQHLKKFTPDIIFSWSFFTNAFCCFSYGYRFIGSLRQGYAKEQMHLSYLRRFLSLMPKTIVVNSNFVADELADSGIPAEKIKTVFNIFTPDASLGDSETRIKAKKDLRVKYNIPENAVVIAGAGRNSPTKDFPFFIKVIQTLKRNNSNDNLYAIIFGSGGIAVKHEVEKYNLCDNVILTGDVEGVAALFPIADIFFLSSIQEGMPNVLLEAISAGCTPVATDVGGVRDIFNGLSNELLDGVLIDERTSQIASEKLQCLIDNLESREKVSKLLIDDLDRYLPDTIIKIYENILHYK